MQALYERVEIPKAFDGYLSPGGEDVTKVILEHLRRVDGLILDAGCGTGQFLKILLEAGHQGLGIDPHAQFIKSCHAQGLPALMANMEDLPFAPNSLAAIVCRCSWNLSQQERALSQFYRALKPSGLLIISDIFNRGLTPKESWPLKTCLSGAIGEQAIKDLVATQGFSILGFYDHSVLLKQQMAEFIFRYGSLTSFWHSITGCTHKAEQAACLGRAQKPGLFLLIAQKTA